MFVVIQDCDASTDLSSQIVKYLHNEKEKENKSQVMNIYSDFVNLETRIAQIFCFTD